VILDLGPDSPVVHPTAWVAPTAVLVGRVLLGAASSAWYGAVVRADLERIEVGARTNLQDGCVLHADPGFALVVGDDVTVGHRAVLHGCTVEDGVLIGMGSVVMNGCVVGAGSLVAAGTLLTEGTVVPPRSLVMGAPGKVRGELTDEQSAALRLGSDHYVELAERHRAASG
jgi:carbonic anhydrase/acetyltransferase-like protein (isoleucine patch superfamily)